jgi:hypothetical protein
VAPVTVEYVPVIVSDEEYKSLGEHTKGGGEKIGGKDMFDSTRWRGWGGLFCLVLFCLVISKS